MTPLAMMLRLENISIREAAQMLFSKTGVAISTTYMGSIIRGDRFPSMALSVCIAQTFGLTPDQVRSPKKGRSR